MGLEERAARKLWVPHCGQPEMAEFDRACLPVPALCGALRIGVQGWVWVQGLVRRHFGESAVLFQDLSTHYLKYRTVNAIMGCFGMHGSLVSFSWLARNSPARGQMLLLLPIYMSVHSMHGCTSCRFSRAVLYLRVHKPYLASAPTYFQHSQI